MKLLKRITALMAAILIAVNIIVVNTSAAMAAPVAAEDLAEILIAMLISAGHSQSEINGMSLTQMQSVLNDDINSGKITFDTTIVDPITGANMKFIEFCQSDTSHVAYAVYCAAVNKWLSDWRLGFDSYFVPTPTTDLMGGGAKIVMTYSNGNTRIFICSYAVVGIPDSMGRSSIIIYSGDGDCYQYDKKNGEDSYKLTWSSGGLAFSYVGDPKFTDFGIVDNSGTIYQLYGDIRTLEGEQFETDDEWEYQLGEVDGTVITPDMLNPDGTVTIDGVTYYPADYLDPDKLSEEGKKQLINNIANVINNTYVISQDKPIVDVDDITVEVAEEFQDYAVPIGIANVFPFCIPWDIVRGFQLLNRPAVVPRFEIPFNIPEFGLFPGVEKSITLDFSKYDTYIQIFRWFQVLGFSFLLCKLSMTQVKGAGA